MLYPLIFEPIFQERIWGGRSLERLYAKPLPDGKTIGESWEICDRLEAQSIVANGPLAGKSLRWLMENCREELLGTASAPNDRFPLLVKILDAEDRLSLQVHPPAFKAAKFKGEAKTELWFITEAKPGAELYVGLRRGVTRHEFEEQLGAGTVADCFHRVPVRSGDCMFLPSGRVHAIGAGLVIFEIQQNSDTTFRVFDWNRVDGKGQPRQLHVAESLECIDFQDFEPSAIPMATRDESMVVSRQILAADPLFKVECIQARAGAILEHPSGACEILGVAKGTVRIGGLPGATLAAGQFCLLPAGIAPTQIEAISDACLLSSVPGI